MSRFNDYSYYKNRRVLQIVALALFVIFVVATLLGRGLFTDIETVLLSASMAALIYISLGTAGKYNRTGICFFLGIFVWLLGDIFWAYNSIRGGGMPIVEHISDNMYLVADYVFLLGAIVYCRDVFKKSDYQRIAVNAFAVAVVTSVIGYRFAINYHNYNHRISVELVDLLLYFFVSVFSIMIAVIVLGRTGTKGHHKSFYMILISMFVFSLVEIRFTYMMIINKEPENDYIDIIYYLCLLVYSFAWMIPDIGEKEIIPKEIQSKRGKYIPWFNFIFILALSVILYSIHFFGSNMLLLMIIVALAYLIMCKTVQANALAEELLARQKDETARLEKMVEEKVKELQAANDHLEYVSNTDALTKLYNRRYGMEHLEKLVKDGSTYPIALYSLDLNYFKPINDNYGHDMGDVVLREVGRRLGNLKQDRCISVRMGGDEFLVIFKNATNEVAVRGIADLICKAMDEPIDATLNTEDGKTISHTFNISASIGIAEIPSDTNDIEDLYKKADDALYTVKHTSEKSSYLLYREMDEFKKTHNKQEQ